MSACGKAGSELYWVCNWVVGPLNRMLMLYCWIVVVRPTFTTGSVSDGLTNWIVPPVTTKRSLFRITSPLLRLMRPRITGLAAVPRTCRLAEPLTLKVRLTRLTLLVERTARLRLTFWLNPSEGGDSTPLENCAMKLLRSKAGVNEMSARFTVPARVALSVDPAR